MTKKARKSAPLETSEKVISELQKLSEKIGAQHPLLTLLKRVPDALNRVLHGMTEEEFTARLIDTVGPAFRREMLEGTLPEAAGTLTAADFEKAANEAARAILEAIETEVERRIKERKEGGVYRFSRHITDGRIWAGKKGLKPDVRRKETDLTEPEMVIEHILLTLLTDHESKGGADYTPELISNQAGATAWEAKAPKLEIPLRDIFKLYTGGKKVGKGDRRAIMGYLEKYRRRVFTWVIETTINGQVFRADVVRPFVQIDFYSVTDSATAGRIEAGDMESRAGAQNVVITFNPAFREFEIKGYSTRPANLHRILAFAAGGAKRRTAEHFRLFDYLNDIRCRQKSQEARKAGGLVTTDATRETMINILRLGGYLESRNANKIPGKIAAVCDDLTRSGLLQSWELKGGRYSFKIHAAPVWPNVQ